MDEALEELARLGIRSENAEQLILLAKNSSSSDLAKALRDAGVSSTSAAYSQLLELSSRKRLRKDDSWETTQLESAHVQSEEVENEYDYVFDNDQQVDFAEDDQGIESVDEDEQNDDEGQQLPVVLHKQELLDLITKNQIVIVAGETGSGKTTQLPQFLLDEGYGANGMIVCTQPRRLAAMSVAARVASERNVSLGSEVGYTIRFEDRTSRKTRLKYMTDGMLLREVLTDPDLSSYSAIMIDEAHERTLSTDVLLALLNEIAQARPELRIIISSATLNSEKFSKYFNNAPVYNVPGRRFSVDIFYTKNPEANYVHAALMTVFQIHTSQDDPGDILVFLPGQEEIEDAAESLEETKRKLGGNIKELIICPVYGNMPPAQQARIFEPTPEGARKVVLATNIAETSLTIDGIVYVIDPGFVKENSYDARSGMENLETKECSQASANQRAGRAGRVKPGKCFRLYTKWAFSNELPKDTTPEILRTNLASVVLQLMSLGVTNVLGFNLLDRPSSDSFIKAMELLYSLGALNAKAQLTQTGQKMVELPIDPMMAKTLLASDKLKCTNDVITIIAMLGELGGLFYRPRGRRAEADRAHKSFSAEWGDHFRLLDVYNRWEATNFSSHWARDHYVQYRTLVRVRNVRKQLAGLCKRLDLTLQDAGSPDAVRRAFVAGYFTHIARMSKDRQSYLTAGLNLNVSIHPSSSLANRESKDRPKLVIYHELVMTSREYMRGCLEIDIDMVQEEAPHFYKSKMLDKPR